MLLHRQQGTVHLVPGRVWVPECNETGRFNQLPEFPAKKNVLRNEYRIPSFFSKSTNIKIAEGKKESPGNAGDTGGVRFAVLRRRLLLSIGKTFLAASFGFGAFLSHC